MGEQMVSWNLPRTTGRVWAYLLMRGESAVLDEIARDLDIAKSGASVGQEILERESAALGARSRKGKRT